MRRTSRENARPRGGANARLSGTLARFGAGTEVCFFLIQPKMRRISRENARPHGGANTRLSGTLTRFGAGTEVCFFSYPTQDETNFP